MHFQPDEMDRRWKFWGWDSGTRYKPRKEVELELAAGSFSQPSPNRAKVENHPLTKEELRRQLAEYKALMGLNAPETSAPAESSSSDAAYGAPQTYATPPPLTSPPMAGIPPPFSPFISGFPPGMLYFLLLYRLVLMYLPLDHHLPDFLRQASHRVLLLSPQSVPHSHLHLSSLLEYRRLAVLQVAFQAYSLRLRLINLFR